MLRDIAVILIVAILWRVTYFLALRPVIDSADSVMYLQAARTIFNQNYHEIDPRIPLLYPALTAILHQWIADVVLAGTCVSLAAGSFLPVVVYLITRTAFGISPARVAACLTVFWPWLVDYACRIAPESLAGLLWLLSLFCLYKASKSGLWWSASAAFFFFLFHLTRPEGTFVMAAAPFVLAGLLWRQSVKRSVSAFFLMVACVVTLVVAQLLLSRWATGEAYINARVPSIQSSFRHTFLERGDASLRAATTLWSHVVPIMIGPYLLAFIGAGLFANTKAPRQKGLEAILGFFCVVQFFLAALSTYSEPRYLMPLVIASAVWAGRGIAVVSKQWESFPHGKWLGKIPLTGALLLFAIGTAQAALPEFGNSQPRTPREYKIVGEWMKQHLPPGIIITRKPQIGFYADMPTTGPAESDTPQTLIERARRLGARYVVIDERYTVPLAPGLRELLDPQKAPPDLRCLRDDLSPYPKARVVVYEVLYSDNAGPTSTGNHE